MHTESVSRQEITFYGKSDARRVWVPRGLMMVAAALLNEIQAISVVNNEIIGRIESKKGVTSCLTYQLVQDETQSGIQFSLTETTTEVKSVYLLSSLN